MSLGEVSSEALGCDARLGAWTVGVVCVGVRVLPPHGRGVAPEGPATAGSVVNDVSHVGVIQAASPPSAAHGLGVGSSMRRSRGKQSGPVGGGGAVPWGGCSGVTSDLRVLRE